MSKAPSSRAPSSKVPKSSRPAHDDEYDDYDSVASARPAASSAPKNRMKSEYPSTIPEGEDDEGIPPAYKSSAPKSTMKSMMKGKSAAPSIAPTMLKRDGTSIAPKSSMPSSKPGLTMLERDGKSVAPKSSMASSKPTALERDLKSSVGGKSRMPTNLNSGGHSFMPQSNVGGQASIAPKSMSAGGHSHCPSHNPGQDSGIHTKSVLTSKLDVTMASRQANFSMLSRDEQKAQSQWVVSSIPKWGPCPEANDWKEVPGGYMCTKGGHGMTHEMIAEGLGAICAMPKGHQHNWDKKEGPYYKVNPDDPNDESRVYDKTKTFPGVAVPEKYLARKK